jgi:hypothetical protein
MEEGDDHMHKHLRITIANKAFSVKWGDIKESYVTLLLKA